MDDKIFFLLFTGVGSSWLDSTVVLFLLLLKWDCRLLQITTSFLILLLDHTYSHKDFSTSLWCHLHNFVFSVLLGGHVLERDSSLSIIVTRGTYFSCANLPFPHAGGGNGWQGTLALLSLTAPPPQCMKPLWGCACDNAYTHRWHLLRCRHKLTTIFFCN